MKWFLQKLTSRKFLAAVTLIIAGLVAMFRDVDPSEVQTQVAVWTAYIPRVVGAFTAILGVLGFLTAEAKVDAARAADREEK